MPIRNSSCDTNKWLIVDSSSQGHNFQLKMHHKPFGDLAHARTRSVAHSAPRLPAGFKGGASGGEGKGERRKEGRGQGRGREETDRRHCLSKYNFSMTRNFFEMTFNALMYR